MSSRGIWKGWCVCGLVVMGAISCTPPEESKVALHWSPGDRFFVAAHRERPWLDWGPSEVTSDESVWSVEVVSAGWIPEFGNPLRRYAQTELGLVSLSVLAFFQDPALNTGSYKEDFSPVVFVVFQSDRDRAVGVVEFLGDDPPRVWTDFEFGSSWSALTQLDLTPAPVFLAPWGTTWSAQPWWLEDGSAIASTAPGDGSIQVDWWSPLSALEASCQYTEETHWPTKCGYGSSVFYRLVGEDLSAAEVAVSRTVPNRDWQSALAEADSESVYRYSITETVDWQKTAWSGSVWSLNKSSMVWGADDRSTISGALYVDALPLARTLAGLRAERQVHDSEALAYEESEAFAALDARVSEYYATVLADFQSGRWHRDGQWLVHDDGRAVDVDSMSTLDKVAYLRLLNGEHDPFRVCSWEILHHWWPEDAQGRDHAAGWAAAAWRAPEPTLDITLGRRGRTLKFMIADQKAVLAEIYGAANAIPQGQNWRTEGADSFDLTPAMFHAFVQRSNNSQSSQGIVDIDPTSRLRPLPLVSAEVRMRELDVPVENPTLNINTASVAQLREKLGLSSSDAEALVRWRYRRGPFSFLEDARQAVGGGGYRKLMGGGATKNDGEERVFAVVADVQFASDAVDPQHADRETPIRLARRYGYTLVTDRDLRILRGSWDNPSDHPDLYWTLVGLSAETGAGQSNPWLGPSDALRWLGLDVN